MPRSPLPVRRQECVIYPPNGQGFSRWTGLPDFRADAARTRNSMHKSTEDLLRFFRYEHLPEPLQAISKPFSDLAHQMAEKLEGAEVTAGLRKLLESKDCFVRAALPSQPSSRNTTFSE
jgi:hypothetical protein